MPASTAAPLHPLHALFLAFPVALFVAALAGDIAFLRTAEMQWSNLAAWAIVGALIGGAVVLVWALAGVLAGRGPLAGRLVYPGLVAAMWLAGLVNAFQHSRDGWASVGAFGLGLSIVAAVLALAAGWIAHAGRVGGRSFR